MARIFTSLTSTQFDLIALMRVLLQCRIEIH